MSGRVVGGLLVEADLQVDPRALTEQLGEALRRRGGELRRGHVASVSRAGAGKLALRIAMDGSEAKLLASRVVIAGAESLLRLQPQAVEGRGSIHVRAKTRSGVDSILRRF